MSKYRKKPVVIDALQWNGVDKDEMLEFCPTAIFEYLDEINQYALSIPTLEGIHEAKVSDYIIKGVKGEFYPCKSEIFKMTYDSVSEIELQENTDKTPPVKSLHNTTSNGARKNVKDIQFWGDGDLFQLISKASSENEGWMKSTKAMQINGIGCVVQVTTQQRNPDGSYSVAEALTFVPNARINHFVDDNGQIVKRELF